MASGDIVDAFERRLPADRIVREGVERYSVDGLLPALAILPAATDEVAIVLRYASELGLAVIPWGSGSHMDLGNRPSRYDVALDLTRLDAVSDFSPEDLVVTAQAGMTIGALNTRLAERGQFFALDTPLAEQATLGGALSANLPGPTRLRYGGGRDLVIGLTCVLSSGEVVHSGGRVVKNVAGYDLNKLYVGALGSLGVIVEASFKLHPLPGVHAAIAATYASCDTAHAAAMALINSSLGPTAVELAGPTPAGQLSPIPASAEDWLLVALMSGLPAAVERQVNEATVVLRQKGAGATTGLTESQRRQLVVALRDYGRDAGAPAVLLLRCNLLPSEIPAAIQQLSGAADLAGVGVTASPGSGSLRLAWTQLPADPVPLVATIRHEIGAVRGTVTVERCPPAFKDGIEVWGIEGADVTLMRDMKAAYDPGGVLSPGRFINRL